MVINRELSIYEIRLFFFSANFITFANKFMIK